MKRIAIIPIDNRPICYTLLEQICAIDNDIKLFMPKRELLGGLATPADIRGIQAWLQELSDIDILIVSLDTIAYGGLTCSRRSEDSYEKVLERLSTFKALIKGRANKVFAFSSIMRISNNNINEEEKEYWNTWGTKIYDYSYNLHRNEVLYGANSVSSCVLSQIPSDILEDYIKTRERNFNVNKKYLEWLADDTLDFLVYSKDDSGEFGLNIKEARELHIMVAAHGLNALVKTGADEIPLALLSRAVCEDKGLKVAPIFLENARSSLNAVSKYEDVTVYDCVFGQFDLAKIKAFTLEEADMSLMINNFQSEQGDLVLGERVNFVRADVFIKFEKILASVDKPYFIADINNANGADNNFVHFLLKSGLDERFYGYSAYNTSANTIGCAICTAVITFFAKDYNDEAFKKLQFTRFMDDWAYQANIRRLVREKAPNFSTELKRNRANLDSFAHKINEILGSNFQVLKYDLPWNRSFEIELEVR